MGQQPVDMKDKYSTKCQAIPEPLSNETDRTASGWRSEQVCHLPGGPATLLLYTGAVGAGPGHLALFDAVRAIDGGTVFVAGPGSTASALWAAQSGAQVITWNDSVAEHQSTIDTLRANGFASFEAHNEPGFESLPTHLAELALLHLPRGREFQRQHLLACGAVVRPGGRVAFVGARDEGVKAAVDEARRLLGMAGVVSRKGGHHAALALATTEALPAVAWHTFDISVDGAATRLESCDGVFAHDRLDGGAAALIESMVLEAGAVVLDLGCGTGLVGLAARRRGARVIATDVSARAVASTRRTHSANGFADTAVHLCIGASALPAASVDSVLANPPFHRGHSVDFDVARLFVAEAARVLRPGGTLFLVANAFLAYRPWLESTFTQVTIAGENRQFRVWRAARS